MSGREASLHLDGTPIFVRPEDRENERTTGALIEAAWSCEIRHFGELSAVDWYSLKMGRLVGVLELKARTNPSTQYPTVYLSVRKWLALLLAGIGLGVPALFVVRFTDCVMWKRVGLREGAVTIGGNSADRGGRIEPLIEVPVASMQPLPSVEPAA